MLWGENVAFKVEKFGDYRERRNFSKTKNILNRIPVIGSFRSVGASVKKMNSILLMEMATYGVFGGALGAVAGVGFTKALFLLFEMMEDSLGVAIEMASFETYGFLIIMLTIVMLVLFQISLSISDKTSGL